MSALLGEPEGLAAVPLPRWSFRLGTPTSEFKFILPSIVVTKDRASRKNDSGKCRTDSFCDATQSGGGCSLTFILVVV
jgi:hypothetical protein